MVAGALLRVESGMAQEAGFSMSSVVGFFGQSPYHASIIPMLMVTSALAFLTRPMTSEEMSPAFLRFQFLYLSVWSLCVAADWLQGPYVYALYASYGFSSLEIAKLFVAGFVASMFFGCVVGPVADKFGRKKCCLAYCVLYIVSCLTKHVRDYWILFFGRVTGGMATSMLFSCFECWMVSEHMHSHRFSSHLLSYMFGLKFMIMYSVAVATGLVAEAAADAAALQPMAEGSIFYFGGSCAPFDVSIVCNVVAFVLIALHWPENYGTAEGAVEDAQGLIHAVKEAGKFLSANVNALCLCCAVACFEGAMYAFVFNWTPALKDQVSEAPTPHGLIFALFMMACMSGASVATLASARSRPTSRLTVVFCLGMAAFSVASFSAAGQGGMLSICFFSFLLFEFCVGMYYPSIGLIKSDLVPEHIRSTIYNIFRVPLNAVVVVLLLTDLSVVTCFRLCAALLAVALLAGLKLAHGSASERKALSEETPLASKSV